MSLATLVTLALAALLVGPALALFWARGRAWRAVIDGLSLALVGGICFLVVFPHAIEVAGPVGFLAIIPGILMPGWFHRLGSRWERSFHYAGLVLLAVHAAVDGAALTVPETSMGVAVVAHRLPMGLAVYSAARRASTRPSAGFMAVGTLLVATLVGVAIGEPMSNLGGSIGHGAFEGFVGGMLLHIVFEHAPVFPAPEHPELLGHGHHHGGNHQHSARTAARAGGNQWSAVGALLGLVLVSGLIWSQGQETAGHEAHAHHASALFTNNLWALTLATAPILMLGYTLAAVWARLIPPSRPDTGLPASGPNRAIQGLRDGQRERLCACDVVPRARTHLAQGSLQQRTLAFLLATPALGIAGLVVSGGMLGIRLTATRIVAAIGLALLATLVVRRTGPMAPTEPEKISPSPPARIDWATAVRFGFGELVDHTIPWIVVGILTAGLGVLTLPSLPVHQWSEILQVPIFAAIGIPLYVCATGATPAAAALIDHGLSSGSAMAILVAGPALNLPAIALMRTHLGKASTRRVIAVVLAVAISSGWAVDALGWDPPVRQTVIRSGLVSWVCLGGLVLLAVRSLFHQGSRGILAQVIEPIEHPSESTGAGPDRDETGDHHGPEPSPADDNAKG